MRSCCAQLSQKGSCKCWVIHYFLVVIVNKLLNCCKRGVYHVDRRLRQDFLDFCEIILPHIDVPYILKNFSRQLSTFIALCVNKVTKVSSSTASWTVKVSTRYRAVVSGLDHLIWVRWRVCCKLSFLNFIGLLEFLYCVVSKLHQLVVVHSLVVGKKLQNISSLPYKKSATKL